MRKQITETQFLAKVGRVYRLVNECKGIQSKMLKTDLPKAKTSEVNYQYSCYKKAITASVVELIKYAEPVVGIINHDNINEFLSAKD